jgi:hypothetical protein
MLRKFTACENDTMTVFETNNGLRMRIVSLWTDLLAVERVLYSSAPNPYFEASVPPDIVSTNH